ncbi:mechanosensitive ion channel family protein [Flexistipes sp.]|uniref:mechanosensitive ion channel family protein n=1 Tax=Flexistipes sp. TaxID=3088135 RepID=UPI002E1EB524|nr:mechanosensitive ion channel domain-containing protein [Flexistipes sp.]
MPNENQIGNIFKSLDSAALLELAIIVVTAILLIVAVQRIVPWVANRLPGRNRLYVLSIVPFFRLLVILAAIFMAIPLLIEPSLQNMVAILGSLGLVLGFALKDYASSLIAGIVATGEFNYRNGDWVQLEDVYGEVRHIGLRTVEIVTPDDNRVLIPHSFLWNKPVINANNGDSRLQCIADFYLNPHHNAQQVQKVLENVALTSPYLYFDSPVVVIVKEEPWGTHYRLKAYPVNSGQQFLFITDMTVRGKAALLDLGVEFPATCAIPSNKA